MLRARSFEGWLSSDGSVYPFRSEYRNQLQFMEGNGQGKARVCVRTVVVMLKHICTGPSMAFRVALVNPLPESARTESKETPVSFSGIIILMFGRR